VAAVVVDVAVVVAAVAVVDAAAAAELVQLRSREFRPASIRGPVNRRVRQRTIRIRRSIRPQPAQPAQLAAAVVVVAAALWVALQSVALVVLGPQAGPGDVAQAQVLAVDAVQVVLAEPVVLVPAARPVRCLAGAVVRSTTASIRRRLSPAVSARAPSFT
jgi:hypothetical protein